MTLKRILFIATASCLLFIGVVGAKEQDNPEGRQLVDDFLNNVITLSGRFEQQLIDADNVVIEESSGMLDIRRPGQFRWTYTVPYEHILVADGLNIWSYDVDLGHVTVKSQAKALSSTPAVLLGGSSDVLDDFNYIGSFADRGTVWVRLRPKETDNGFNKVELGFTDGKLSRMLFVDNLDQTTLIALLDVSINEPANEQNFHFVPPAGVDVDGTPLVASTSDR